MEESFPAFWFITDSLHEFIHALLAHSATPPKGQPSRVRWIPPQEPFLKVNYVGAVFHNRNEVGIEIVVHDHLGQFLASMSNKVPLPSSVDTMEYMVIVWALHFASECVFSYVILEGDSKTMFKDLGNGNASLSSFGH